MQKVSVIVPVYNTEKYLHHCIDSILAQTFKDFELLLIDDGSTDKSKAICDEYAAKDSRVCVCHKVNGGVSSARNVGLDNAKGEYVIFSDADDYWYDGTALEVLIDAATKYDLDIVRGEYKAVDQVGDDLFERPLTKSKKELSNKVLTSGIFYTQIMSGENFLVLSLIKRNVIGNLRLNVSRSFLEDMEFYTHILLQPLRCMFVPIRFYAYRKLQASASHTPKIKNLADSFSMCDVFDICSKKANDDELRKAYTYNSIMMYYWTLDTITLNSYFPRRKEIIKDLKLGKLQKKVYEWSKNTSVNYPIIIKLSPIIGVWLLKFKHMLGLLFRKIRSFF